MTTFWIIIFAALGISFICSLLEACVLSLSTADIARISEKKPLIGRLWKSFREDVQRPITVILVINTLAHTIGATLSGATFDQVFGSKWVFVFSLVFSFVMIQWTEILPKTLGVRYNRQIAVLAAAPFKLLLVVFTPVVNVVQFLNRPFIEKKKESAASAIEDISVLARFAALQNVISKDQEKILSQTINLTSMKVKDIMVDRDEIKFLSSKMSLMEALLESHVHHHTRFPLIANGDKDKVLGYVNFKDIVGALQMNPQNASLTGICRPLLEVRDEEQVSQLLSRLTRSYQHIALVRDISNRVVGLVALEDVIESIMGELYDEYDVLPVYCYPIAANRYVAGGGITLKSLRERSNIDVPGTEQQLNDWLMGFIGRQPKVEDKISYAGNTFIARKIRRSSIFEVIIQIGHK